jgi:DNA-binding NarL/FixJ family response regulator
MLIWLPASCIAGKNVDDFMTLRCLIVEDQLMFLQMLQGMLRSLPNLIVVGAACSEPDGIEACNQYQPDLLLLDLSLRKGHGLHVARHLSAIKPSSRSIILSGEASTFVCPEDLNGHIHAVLDKTQAFDDLTAELRTLLPMDRDSTARMPADPQGILSPREYEIFQLIGLGLLSKEIGDKLSISIYTVQAHRKQIASKLGTTGVELLKEALRHHHESRMATS